ncbi:hypothetical protein [Planotetraspora sp. GP83]|uniref:hypothetical protein n=1 Tax=Planotetraspora sp. GP83 TaxID=3156264 RepID=UPI003512AF87
MLAVDGKALRGTPHHTPTGRATHLPAVTDTRTLAVLGQVEVDGKQRDHRVRAAAGPVDLTDTVITADALHTQREHAVFLVERKNAHYILTAKKNQPPVQAAQSPALAQGRHQPQRNRQALGSPWRP